ncbi:hypothetical protein [Muriicola sp.]|uniref:hypothetical protein n=1 Tax=Muriicola sp. TaxID=2020856 RepID=UPI003C7162FA
MVKSEKKEHSAFIEKSVHHLEARGFDKIRVDLEGYDKPKSFLRKRDGTNVTPDIVANKDGKRYFFEISLKTEEPRLLKSKWVFLDALSRMKSDSFRIITTKGHYKFTDSVLEDINLSNKVPIKI